MNLSPSLHQISPMKATSILSRFLAYEIAVPISQPEKTLEFQNYKLIFFIYLYLLFSLNVVNELSCCSGRMRRNLKKRLRKYWKYGQELVLSSPLHT